MSLEGRGSNPLVLQASFFIESNNYFCEATTPVAFFVSRNEMEPEDLGSTQILRLH